MENRSINKKQIIHTATGVGIFSALAFIVSAVCEVIPNVAGFLSIDVKDAVIAIASFIYGPFVAPVISLIVASVELVTIGSDTSWYGFVMNFASSATFSFVVSFIYSYRKSINTALIGFLASIVTTTGVMLLLNAYVTPIYVELMGIPFDVVKNLPVLFLPFNFAKTLLNSAVAMLLYKPIINGLRMANLIPRSEHKSSFNKNTIIILSVGGALLATSVAIFIVLWMR
jgi:riboflavin transporter FmnP